jgi:NAD(P)-dependent dehydrogenase (short-subunit alcohol dehydrogenase family)
MTIRFDGQVAIVTGAGNGLGRTHALALAAHGAKVVVNDLGGARDGSGGSLLAADDVVREIQAQGGEAMASAASVIDEAAVAKMVANTLDRWGRVDILVNNAGILRDKSLHKMDLADFRTVLEVHLMGSVICSKAVWPSMRDQAYGRIVMTTSSSGLYGNFGQSNYGAAKLGLVGFMKSLYLEGAKFNIKVNSLCPVAATRMTEDIMPADMLALLAPEDVTPALLYLVSQEAPTNSILTAGAGSYALARIFETQGVYLAKEARTPEMIASLWDKIADPQDQQAFETGAGQGQKFLGKALAARQR